MNNETCRHHHEHCHCGRQHLCRDSAIGRAFRTETGVCDTGQKVGTEHPVADIDHDTALADQGGQRNPVEPHTTPDTRDPEHEKRIEADIGEEGRDLATLHGNSVTLRLQQPVDTERHHKTRHGEKQHAKISRSGIAVGTFARNELDELGADEPGGHHQHQADDRPVADAPRRHKPSLIRFLRAEGIADKRRHRRRQSKPKSDEEEKSLK